MKATKRQVTARVFKKLSALRATLSNEERGILDGLLLIENVSAHQMKTGAVTRARKNTRAVTKAHQMKQGAVTKALKNSRAVTQAHQMKTGAVTKALKNSRALTVAHKMKDGAIAKVKKPTLRVEFDINSEEYKVQD